VTAKSCDCSVETGRKHFDYSNITEKNVDRSKNHRLSSIDRDR